MPIQSIRLRNFRCFLDSGDIAIRPLTIVFGRNNAGKSSILDSLFLLRQTLDQPEYEDGLNMRGPLYPAGGFADIVHKHRSSQTITMEFGIAGARSFEPVGAPAHRKYSGKLTFEFASQEPRPPRLVRFRIESEDAPTVEIRRGRGRGGRASFILVGK
jgi:predicted ATPase